MIDKTDVFSLLVDLKDKGVDINGYMKELYSTTSIPLDIIKFLNEQRSFDVASFYEKLRYNHNHKKSDLYFNIVKELEADESILTTLAAYNLQALLFAKKIDNKEMFYKNARVKEVNEVLSNYFETFDIDSCIKILSLIKADIKLFESIKKN